VAALLVCGVLVLILWSVVRSGSAALSWDFLTQTPRSAGRAGGIAPILVSTLLILLVCLSASVPLSLAAAAYLAEFTSRTSLPARLIRISLDTLAGVPSIVFGLFGNALFCRILGLRFSILSGGLTLACMVLPLLIRISTDSLLSVPDSHRQAAAALGLSRTATLARITLPLAAPGIAAGLILSIGRALAETAALIFTSGYVDRMPGSLLDSGRSLSIHIYDLSMHVPGGDPMAGATALVLVVLLGGVNLATVWLTPRLLSSPWSQGERSHV